MRDREWVEKLDFKIIISYAQIEKHNAYQNMYINKYVQPSYFTDRTYDSPCSKFRYLFSLPSLILLLTPPYGPDIQQWSAFPKQQQNKLPQYSAIRHK